MELTLRRPMLALPARLLAIALALLLLLIAALSVPLMFGSSGLPATVATEWHNGLIAWAKDGDLWVVDPAVGEPRILVPGPGIMDGPDWSPDGTRILFGRYKGLGQALVVGDADGSNARELDPEPLVDIAAAMWSPDSSAIAFVSTVDGTPAVSLVRVDGGSPVTLALGHPADWVAWHPDGRSILVRLRTPDGTGLYQVAVPDGVLGTALRMSDTASPFYQGDRGANDLMESLYSPDGSRISYIQGQLTGDGTYGVFGGPDTRNHVMNADGSDDRVLEFSPTSDYEDGASFSPDGSRLSMVIREGDKHQIAIMTLDGSRPPVASDPESDPNAMPAYWSPDGRRILAVRIADGVSYLIEPETGVKVRQPWLANWADWQPVAPS